MSAISVRWLSISWGAVIFETNYGLMQHSHIEIKNKLLNALDADYNVVDMATVCEIVTILEKIPITTRILEDTRLGKVINEFRRKTRNEVLAKRAKDLVRRWRHIMLKEGSINTNTNSADKFHQNGDNDDVCSDVTSGLNTSTNYSHSTKRRINKLNLKQNNVIDNGIINTIDDSNSDGNSSQNDRIVINRYRDNSSVADNSNGNNINSNVNAPDNDVSAEDRNSHRRYNNQQVCYRQQPHHRRIGHNDAVPRTHVSNKRLRKETITTVDVDNDENEISPLVVKRFKLNGISGSSCSPVLSKSRNKNGVNINNNNSSSSSSSSKDLLSLSDDKTKLKTLTPTKEQEVVNDTTTNTNTNRVVVEDLSEKKYFTRRLYHREDDDDNPTNRSINVPVFDNSHVPHNDTVTTNSSSGNNNDNNMNNPNGNSSDASTAPTTSTTIDIVVLEDNDNIGRKKRSSKKKKENHNKLYDDILKEKLLGLVKTRKVKTTEELINGLTQQQQKPTTSTQQYDQSADVNVDQKTSLTHDDVSRDNSVAVVITDEEQRCKNNLQSTTIIDNNNISKSRNKDRYRDVKDKPNDPTENEIATIVSKLNTDSIVWSSDEDYDDYGKNRILSQSEIEARADLLNSDEQLEGVTGNFDHRDGKFKEWHHIVTRRTAHDEFIHILPYTIID